MILVLVNTYFSMLQMYNKKNNISKIIPKNISTKKIKKHNSFNIKQLREYLYIVDINERLAALTEIYAYYNFTN